MASIARGADLIAIGVVYVPPLVWLTDQLYSFLFTSEEVTRVPQPYTELVKEKGGWGGFLWLAQRRHRIVRGWLIACVPALIWSLGFRQ